MKRFLFVFVILCLVVAVAPLAVIADEGVCNDVAYHEGIFVSASIHGGKISAGSSLLIEARKTVDGDWRESVVHLRISQYNEWEPARNLDIDATFVVPIDPDWLEVSCDLGWGGLDTVVEVYDRANNRMVPVEIHLDLYGLGDYWYEESTYYFKRDAAQGLRGYVSIPGIFYTGDFENWWQPVMCSTYPDCPWWTGNLRSISAHNFSTQWPG